MTADFELFIEGLPPSPNATTRKHWTVQAANKREWTEKVGWLAKAKYHKQPLERASVHFNVQFGDNRRHDADNVIASLKGALDGLVGIVIKDDSIDCIELSYSFSREKPRGFSIQVSQVA